MGDKNKKKLTKKEQKAINHAKLMSNKSASSVPGASSNTNNVVQLNAYQNQKDKKAA